MTDILTTISHVVGSLLILASGFSWFFSAWDHPFEPLKGAAVMAFGVVLFIVGGFGLWGAW